ncbi:hypothetical protein M0805_006297 [Coniferiporia weirii]|nr:hypothetical protein M0805_006297 [Coniferiporia weirii]
MAVPSPSVQAGPSARVSSRKRPASASLSDADTLSTNTASTSTMRSNTAAVDAHKKKRRRRRKPSVTKATPSFVRTIQRDDNSPVSSGSGSLKGKERAIVLDDVPELPSEIVPDANGELASLREKIEQQTTLLTTHKDFFAALAPSLTCQICLEPMHRPYALAPCGHTACYGCLIAWFRAPPQHITHPPPPHLAHNFDREDPSLLARDTPMLLRKEKTCPHCRAVVREVPVEAWGIKDIVAHLFASKGNMAKDLYPDHVKPPETRETGISQPSADAWKGVFKPDHARAQAIFNTLINLGTGGGAAEANEDRGRDGDRGFYDDEDNVYRCTVCYHEVWDGICTACGRLYPGLLDHAEEDDDGDDDGGDWMDAENFQEEDWMDAHGDADYGDPDDDVLDLHEIFGEFARNARLMRAANHREDEEEGYESSFIDDEEGGARIEEYHSAEEAGRSGSGDEAGGTDEGRPRPLPPTRIMRTARRHSADPANTTIHLSDSDSDASGHVANYRRRRGPRALIDSDAEDVDNSVEHVGPALTHQPAPRAVRPIVVDSDSGSEDGRRSDTDAEEVAVFRSRSLSRGNSISGDDSDELSEHREFYGSGSGSSHYNDAFSDEDNGINWSD